MGNDRFVFVLRLWREESATISPAHTPPLRGSIERVDTRELRYFDDLANVETVLRALAGWGQETGEAGRSPGS